MAPTDAPPATNGSPPPPSPRIGPHPGFISSANQYTTETRVTRKLRDNNCDPAREVTYRLQGVQLIDNVREHLRLPVRTFDTACVYFHKFRLNFRDAEYNYQDAALAALFVACKVEDTIKKSRDILAAAYNVKNPEKPVSSDDKIFENPGKIIIGLERLILETIGFDFRTRYPQKLLVKILRRVLLPPSSPSSVDEPMHDPDAARAFFATAYAMSIDLYKTFAPIKRTTFAMAMAVAELTARTIGGQAHILERLRAMAADKARLEQVRDARNGDSSKQQGYSRTAVTETMLDLLDLYVQNARSTKVGLMFDLNRFIEIKLQLNGAIESDGHPRHLHQCTRCEDAGGNNTSSAPLPLTPASTTSPATSTSDPGGTGRRTTRGQDGTVRFVFDPEMARVEKDASGRYFNEEFEEYEVEVDEPVPPPPRREDEMGRGGRGRGRGRGGFHRDRGDHRWGGPYAPRGDRGGGGGGGYRGGGRGRYQR
ncbi:C-type cyclin [Sarocladium implicatum]|nr:C-type cyclin [Sarocladium implicatum]